MRRLRRVGISGECGRNSVRRAHISEATAVANVLITSRKSEPAIPPGVHPDGDVRAWVREVLWESAEVWVATNTEQPVAMMALADEWIELLYVLPGEQGKGHGRALVQLAQEERDSLSLWTFVSNDRARRFYESLGFEQSGPASSDNEEGAPALRYRWSRP